MSRRLFLSSVLLLLVTVVLFAWRTRPRWQAPPDASPDTQFSDWPKVPRKKTAQPATPPEVLAQGSWGVLGRRNLPDGTFEGPMSVLSLPNGDVLVLDQVHRRIVRIASRQFVTVQTLRTDTAQDFVALATGGFAVLDRFPEHGIEVYRPDTPHPSRLHVPGAHDLGGFTGFFSDEHGLYIERDFLQVYKLADARGTPLPVTNLLGRPGRGPWLLSAWFLDRPSWEATLHVYRRHDGEKLVETKITGLPMPILQLGLFAQDRRRQLYLVAVCGIEETNEPYRLLDQALFTIRFSKEGHETGRFQLPPLGREGNTFRPLFLDDEGRLLLLRVTEADVSVERYTFGTPKG